MAFVDYKPNKGAFDSPFIGLKNFNFFFKSLDFSIIFGNTIRYNLLFLFVGTLFSLLLAILLYEILNKAALKVFQTAFFLPYFISWILVSYIVQAFIDSNGMVTALVENMVGRDVNMYTELKAWPAILVIVNTWKGAGVSAIVYYATLLNCDMSLFEAAQIDGANKMQKIWFITLPYLRPMVVVNVIMSGANILRSDLGLFMFVPKDSATLRPATDVIDYYIWRTVRETGNFEIGTAVGLVQGLIGLVLTIIVNKVVNKVEPGAALY